jgi:uncharacterized membrane protein YphA (DoxX/SURF4 family)
MSGLPRLFFVGLLLVTLLLTAFFGFVGFMKAFAPLPELAVHRAWVVGLPAALLRTVGWSEMLCAAALIAGIAARPKWAAVAALVLIANQIVALTVHFARGEHAALPQNFVLIALLTVVLIGARALPLRRAGAAVLPTGG